MTSLYPFRQEYSFMWLFSSLKFNRAISLLGYSNIHCKLFNYLVAERIFEGKLIASRRKQRQLRYLIRIISKKKKKTLRTTYFNFCDIGELLGGNCASIAKCSRKLGYVLELHTRAAERSWRTRGTILNFLTGT